MSQVWGREEEIPGLQDPGDGVCVESEFPDLASFPVDSAWQIGPPNFHPRNRASGQKKTSMGLGPPGVSGAGPQETLPLPLGRTALFPGTSLLGPAIPTAAAELALSSTAPAASYPVGFLERCKISFELGLCKEVFGSFLIAVVCRHHMQPC